MANEFIVKNGLVTPNQQFSGSTSGSTTVVATATASGTLTLPAATDTLVGKATTDTLTNKTINLANNTLTATSAQILAAVADETGSGVLVFNTTPTLVTPILGTPTSVTLTNATGLPISTGVSGLATGAATFLATPSSANLAALLTDETGTGASVFGTSPAITTSLTTPSTSFDLINTTATTVNFAKAATALSIGAATGTTTVNNGLVVTGDLTVNGTTTTVNATTITVDDINIELGSVASPTDVTAAGGGITLKGATDKTISWSASNGWTSSETFNIATGKTYKINGTDVLSATTLGSGVTGSSLTSVGTIGTGTWSASFGAVSGANLTSLTAGNLSGTIPSGVLGNSTVNIGTTAVALNRASANQALTGISSVTLPGSTSGTAQVTPPAVAGTGTVITLPGATGTLATLAGTETLTNKTIAAGSNTISGLTNSNLSGTAGITNANLANTTISGVALGGTLATFTTNVSGTGLSGSTTYNGSAAATFTVTSNATSANTASTIVARDASGNFTAGTITAALSGNATTSSSTTGNAATITSQANSATITSSTAATANQIVLRDGNGDIFSRYDWAQYFNTSGGGSERNASGMAYFAGFNSSDYYIRSYTPAAVASAIQSSITSVGALSTGNLTATGTIASTGAGTLNGFTFSQNSTVNLRVAAAAAGAVGLLGVDSAGTFRYQIYGDGSNYGFLQGAWGNWDLNKNVNGEMGLTVSGTVRTVIHSGNVSSYVTSVPSQTGNAGKYLKTDGTTATWQTAGGMTRGRAAFYSA